MATTEDLEQHYMPVGCLVYPLVDLPKALRPFNTLAKHKWIRIESIISNDDENIGISRIFVLPDDSFNGTISRTDPTLRKKKQALLSSLDYSSATWNGLSNHDGSLRFPTLSPRAKKARDRLVSHDAGEDIPLLKIFNTIPSPRPNVRSVEDGLPKEIMSELLSSTVEGLTTEMYPYQCRSAALMYQKEVHPGHVLDPRLVEVIDQDGKTWYYNSVESGAFREPRYYDGIRGGILAEEMGSGKTLICLALIAATRHQPAAVPDVYQGNNGTVRPRIGSLVDMAAAVATNHAAPWKRYIDPANVHCIRALERNPGWYHLPAPEIMRMSRRHTLEVDLPPRKVYLSHTTLVVVPANLFKQWEQEISKHTKGLNTLAIKKETVIPPPTELLHYDIVLCTVNFLEGLWIYGGKRAEPGGSYSIHSPLGQILFKRCIVDEGHKLGNVKLSGAKTSVLQLLDCLHITARWIATGTPSKGLFGMEEGLETTEVVAESSAEHESKDLERIGAIATSYLRARPWSNTIQYEGDTMADWKVYVMQPKHNSKSKGRQDCLRSSLNSLIVRHRLSEISHMLPSVEAKVVKLEGSYQDKLSMNLFSMMITFNAVQSQRTDQDFFFHQRSRKSLLQLVHNLRQASFFGGSFFSCDEIQKSVETAEEFVNKGSVPITENDDHLLRAAVAFGKLAVRNAVKRAANVFHEMPIYIRDFPGGMAAAWSMTSAEDNGVLMCTNSKLMLAAQKILRPFLDSTEDLNTYLNSGSLQIMGDVEREAAIRQVQPQKKKSKSENTLAGNTKLGEDHVSPRKRHTVSIKDADKGIPTPPETPGEGPEIAAPLADTQLISTCSAKLSYLIDAIVKHQEEEQILVFYENDNVAWYLAGMLEMLQIHHLIYAQGISADRRSQYISTFNNSSKFRVMLMDISQAAFGLDMRSASRIYFINPVLNPQVEAQAIGRVKRISQQRKVTVETLVLRDSLEEVIMERKQNMTQAEHRNCKTILDDRPIYEWILNPRIIPLPEVDVDDGPGQMAPLAVPQYIFGREFGRGIAHPDEDILLDDPSHTASSAQTKGKRPSSNDDDPRHGDSGTATPPVDILRSSGRSRPAKRARFADATGSADSDEWPVGRTPEESGEARTDIRGPSSPDEGLPHEAENHRDDGVGSGSETPRRPRRVKRARFADGP
ncbi:hypothetical protein VMCG_07275 [Cytospora schulzeri]|uniref:Helicase C-terminal domain-containing protein n=1 Tax=Cytospora schulzeri TaxID=448051 RepID=A0A423WAG9_9PEZI|nr:hypothetical protein VMCG_07275 [Valsa malicola]